MFIFLDTETTDTGPDDRLCQLAFKTEDGMVVNELFNPGRPISIEAMSVNHITNQMVKDKPPFKGSEPYRILKDLIDDSSKIIVAHNAKFDIGMLNREDLHPFKSICTLNLSRYLDKNGVIPQYNLQYLRYYLDLNVDATPHNAAGDILVLEELFKRIYAKFKENGVDDIESEMIHISNSPVLVSRMPFGKHKGMVFSEIPMDYIEWLQGTDLDEDPEYTVRYHLGLISEN